MAAAVPADILQFYAAALKLAQEIAYLYGEEDLWKDGLPGEDRAADQLILYCGVMLEAAGAEQSVRLMASSWSKQAARKLPQKALTKTFYYPIVRSILKFFGVKLAKDTFARSASKAVPVLGGIVSGGVTFASLRPMGIRLMKTFDKAHFSYSDIDIRNDIRDIEEETARIEAEGQGRIRNPEPRGKPEKRSVPSKKRIPGKNGKPRRCPRPLRRPAGRPWIWIQSAKRNSCWMTESLTKRNSRRSNQGSSQSIAGGTG